MNQNGLFIPKSVIMIYRRFDGYKLHHKRLLLESRGPFTAWSCHEKSNIIFNEIRERHSSLFLTNYFGALPEHRRQSNETYGDLNVINFELNGQHPYILKTRKDKVEQNKMKLLSPIYENVVEMNNDKKTEYEIKIISGDLDIVQRIKAFNPEYDETSYQEQIKQQQARLNPQHPYIINPMTSNASIGIDQGQAQQQNQQHVMQQIVDALSAEDRNKLNAMTRADQQRWFQQMLQKRMAQQAQMQALHSQTVQRPMAQQQISTSAFHSQQIPMHQFLSIKLKVTALITYRMIQNNISAKLFDNKVPSNHIEIYTKNQHYASDEVIRFGDDTVDIGSHYNNQYHVVNNDLFFRIVPYETMKGDELNLYKIDICDYTKDNSVKRPTISQSKETEISNNADTDLLIWDGSFTFPNPVHRIQTRYHPKKQNVDATKEISPTISKSNKWQSNEHKNKLIALLSRAHQQQQNQRQLQYQQSNASNASNISQTQKSSSNTNSKVLSLTNTS